MGKNCLEFSVEAAISLSFDYLSIVTEVFGNSFFGFFQLFQKTVLISVRTLVLKLVWVFLP